MNRDKVPLLWTQTSVSSLKIAGVCGKLPNSSANVKGQILHLQVTTKSASSFKLSFQGNGGNFHLKLSIQQNSATFSVHKSLLSK